MKTVLTGIVLGIVFSIALFFGNRAFASDTLPDCAYMIWKQGQYICIDLDYNSWSGKRLPAADRTQKFLIGAPLGIS